MAHHDEILAAARRICEERGEKTFSADDVVRALPHVNAGTVRTHVTSRCCTNAPKNHPHKWDYFKRLRRGVYQLTTRYRPPPKAAGVVRQRRAEYTTPRSPARRRSIHAATQRTEGWYSA